jgi:hypothetical protein
MTSELCFIEHSSCIIYKHFSVTDIASAPRCNMILLEGKAFIISAKMKVLLSDTK